MAPYLTKSVQDKLLSIKLTLTMTVYCPGFIVPGKLPGPLELADVTEKKKCYIIAPEFKPLPTPQSKNELQPRRCSG